MTNEEKAIELVPSITGYGSNYDAIQAREIAVDMAEWKDEQIKIVLWSHWEKLKDENRTDAAIAVSDIIGELFCDDE